MRAKQVVAVILISASTAIATMWGYNHFSTGGKTYYYSQDSGKVPSNYAKFFEGGNKPSGGPADFTEGGQRGHSGHSAHQDQDRPHR